MPILSRTIRRRSTNLQNIVTRAAVPSLLFVALISNQPAAADTVSLSYNFSGSLVAPPSINGSVLTADSLASGNVTQWNSSVNALWNPVIFQAHSVVDLTTGLNNGTFTMLFADGDTLQGRLFEDDSGSASNGAGVAPQTLTFTAGTGTLAGATGTLSGLFVIGSNGFTTSGSGSLTAPGVFAPEPQTIALLLCSGIVMAAGRKLRHLVPRGASHERRKRA